MCLEARDQPRGCWEWIHRCRQDLWVLWSEHWKPLGVAQPPRGRERRAKGSLEADRCGGPVRGGGEMHLGARKGRGQLSKRSQ